VTKLFWSCVMGALCHCCWAKSSVRRINKCLIWCLPARSCIQQVCARSMSHKSLRPCCFRFMTRTVHVSAMRRCAVPSGLRQMAQIGLRKTREWPDILVSNTSHAVTWLTIRESSRLNIFWDSERSDVMDYSVTVLLTLLEVAFWAEQFCMNDLPWRCAEQCGVSGLCTASRGVTDAHQHVATERAVADLASFVFMRSHVRIWTFLFVILTSSFCEKFRDNSRKYVRSTDVFFRLVTNKSLWNVALYKKAVWEKWCVCPRSSYNFRRLASCIIR